jgi:hypothetical protein
MSYLVVKFIHDKLKEIKEFSMKTNRERGVAIFYILAGVVLFGALTFSFMRSVTNTSSSANRGQTKVIAQDILRYATSVEKTVERLRLVSNCSENDISFYSSEWTTPANFDNANSAFADGDFTCHVYNVNGGGLNFEDPQGNSGTQYFFTGDLSVQGIGSTAPELLLILPNVTETVCTEINRSLDIPAIPADTGDADYAGAYFQGSYTAGDSINDTNLNGKSSGCFEGGGTPAAGTYHFYHTLIAR